MEANLLLKNKELKKTKKKGNFKISFFKKKKN